MEWLVFALLGPVFWGMAAVIDKFLLDKMVKDSLSYSILMEFLWVIFVVGVILTKTVSFNLPFAALAMFAGMLGMSGYFLYCRAMSLEEASRIMPLSHLTTIFTTAIAFLFLNEIFTGVQYLGILMAITGAALLSYKKAKNKRAKKGTGGLPLSPALIFVIFQCILWACSDVIQKYVLFSIDYWSLFVWIATGEIIVTVLVLTSGKVRKRVVDSLKSLESKRKFVVIALGSEVSGFISMIVWFIAISLGPVSLVSAVTAIGPLYVFGIMLLLSVFRPKILKEEISRSTVSLKLLGILMIFAGVWFVTAA